MSLCGRSGRRRYASAAQCTPDTSTCRPLKEVGVKKFPCIVRRAAFRLCREATRAVLAVGALLIFGSASYGQPTYEVLSTFDAANHRSASPYDELIEASDGNFYGTTIGGGAS